MKYKKLVRDNIPDVIKANGEKPIIRKLKLKEYQVELKKKLVEEVSEAVNTKTHDDLVEELADVREVLTSIYDAFNIECGEVTNTARKKRKKRGGFSKRIYLEGVK
jgi:predicted house-cleaning noncanonical NTP pyrophosphatase (MazG superfamily)